MKNYQVLAKCYKGAFPFKLATTSYIYPDHILPNVDMLSPALDEIELVLFESESQNNLPDEEEINQLMSLSVHHGVNFNVHLPIDIFLGDESREVRARGVSIVRKVVERTLCLNPSVYILHLDKGAETDLKEWQERIVQSLRGLSGCGIESKRIAVETLEYPFEWVEDIVKRFDFSICLDIGHILTHGQNLRLYLKKYLPETSTVHLHGFQNGVDHQGIDRLPEGTLEFVLSHLREYHGIVSIEVFSIDDLKRSLILLEEKWEGKQF